MRVFGRHVVWHGIMRVRCMTSYYRIKQHLQIKHTTKSSALTSCARIADTTPFHKINADEVGIAIVVYLDRTWRWDYKLILYPTLQVWTHSNTSKVTNVHADCEEPIRNRRSIHSTNKKLVRAIIASVVYIKQHMRMTLIPHSLHRTPYNHL